MAMGRWANLRTVKIYVDEARVLLSNRTLPDALRANISVWAQNFDQLFT